MTKILCVLFLMPVFLLAQVEIHLPVEVEVSSKTEYSLYDLVFLKQGTPDELEELKKIPVAFLSKKGILEAVKDSPIKIKSVFENTFKVTVSSQVNKSEMQRKIANHLTAECNTCIFEVQIQKIPFLNETNMSFRSTDFEIHKGSFMLPLWDTKQNSKVYATGTWRTFRKVALSNKWLAQGHRLSNSADLLPSLATAAFPPADCTPAASVDFISFWTSAGSSLKLDSATTLKVTNKNAKIHFIVSSLF